MAMTMMMMMMMMKRMNIKLKSDNKDFGGDDASDGEFYLYGSKSNNG